MKNETQVVVTSGDLLEASSACISIAMFFGLIVWAIVYISGWGPVSISLTLLSALLIYASIAPFRKASEAMQKVCE